MVYDLFVNITILVSFLFIMGQVLKNYSIGSDSSFKVKIGIGSIFGIMGIILMVYSIHVTDIIIVDLRNLAMICAGIFGGPLSVIISSIIIALFRVVFFGINIASVVAFIVALIVGFGSAYISKTDMSRVKKFILMFLLGMFVSNIALLFLMSNSPKLAETLFYYWLIYVFGAVLAYYTCEYIILNNKTFKELSYYQIMADNLLDMITTHRPDGTYKYASPSSKRLLGNNPEEIIRSSPYDIIYPDDIETVKKVHKGLINHKWSEYTQDLRLKNKDDKYIWVESTFKNITDAEGNVKEIVCATRDISDRKRTEAELKKRSEQAVEANRLKSQFLANMSHELRTPLNSIIGFTTRVLKKSEDKLSDMQRENLIIVKEEANHLLSLINDLLDYSKIEAGKMDIHIESFNLESVVDDVYSMTESIIKEKQLAFKKIVDNATDLKIKSDYIKVKQILINLLSNAFKYSEKGTVKVIINRVGSFFKIDVVDQGIGIDEKNIDNIFDEFRQVDGSYTRKVGGTGLGLAITKKLVDMLGGSISVNSAVDIGSCFTFYLPVDYNQRDKANSIHAHAELSNKEILKNNGKKKIVCIDDDFNMTRLYRQYLKEEEFEIVILDDKDDIVKKVENIKPIAVILDIILPKRDGWDILNELKENERTKDIPVIMASVLNEQKIAYKMKADDYLVKPVSQKELITAINQIAGQNNSIEVLVDDDKNKTKQKR